MALAHDRDKPAYQLNLTEREKECLENVLDDQVHTIGTLIDNLGVLVGILKDLQTNDLIELD